MNKNVSDEVPRLHAYFEEHRKELLDDIMEMIRKMYLKRKMRHLAWNAPVRSKQSLPAREHSD